MTLLFTASGAQIVGDRDHQEDAFGIVPLAEGSGGGSGLLLTILADGMGGHAAGEVAARLTVEQVRDHFQFKAATGLGAATEELHEALSQANAAIHQSTADNPAQQGMGCTLVAVLCDDDRLWWSSVGDSHLYLLRDGTLRKLNADHSYGAYLDSLAAEGKEVGSESRLPRNMLMSALVGEEISMIDLPAEPLTLQPGDRLLLASDGLDTIDHDAIARLTGSHGVAGAAEALLQAVRDRAKPRQDNTTVVVVEAQAAAGDEAPPPAPPPPASPAPAAVPPPASPPPARAVPAAKARRRLSAALLGGIGAALLAAGIAFYLLVIDPTLIARLLGSAPPPPAAVGGAEPPTAQPVPSLAPQPAPQPVPPPAGNGGDKAAAPAEALVQGFRDSLADGSPGPELVAIPAAAFQMGSYQRRLYADEYPLHQVKLAAYAIGRYEVTEAEYALFARATGRPLPKESGDDPMIYPVATVTWDDAVAYADWLSAQTGKRYRLPSEAEWEYAAAAGADTPYWWGYEVGKDNAQCFNCGTHRDPRHPAPIASFPANPLGLFDTAGNVAEWVRDCYHDTYRNAPGNGRPWEEERCGERVVRGGAYSNAAASLRTAKRDHYPPDTALDFIGLRIAREP